MRIAYVLTDHPKVSHTFITAEIHELERLGLEVLPMALNRPDPAEVLTDVDRREVDRTYHVKGTSVTTIARVVLEAAGQHPIAFVRGCARALRSGGTDIGLAVKRLAQFFEAVLVHAHCRRLGVTRLHAHFGQAPATVAWFTAEFANDIGADRRWTWSMTIHGWHEFADEVRSALAPKVHAAELVVCVSAFTRSQLVRLSDRNDWNKLEVVRCGIEPSEFVPLRQPTSPAPRPTIVTVARLAPEKGHATLLEAAARIRADGFDIQLRFIGDGPARTDIGRLIAELGLDDRVDLTGSLPPSRVRAELARADVFCLPTFAEGLPVSIMEAMAAGVPVVTTPVGGITELADDGVTAWLVPPADPEALAAGIRRALADPDRDRIVRSAHERVLAHHDLHRNVAHLAELLRRHHADRVQERAVGAGSADEGDGS